MNKIRLPTTDARIAQAVRAGLEAALSAVSVNAWKHEGDDTFSRGMDLGAREQNDVDCEVIRRLLAADPDAVARIAKGVE